MTRRQLKLFLTRYKMSQADLSRLLFNSCSQSDRVIISTWISGKKTIPRWVPNFLNIYKKLIEQKQLELFNQKINNE
jgi:hypothetical protein